MSISCCQGNHLPMGALTSKREKRTQWNWTGPPGRHSAFPVDYVTYPGPELLYCFTDIMACYEVMGMYKNSFKKTRIFVIL